MTSSWTRLLSGTAVVEGGLGGTRGRSMAGFGPAGLPAPEVPFDQGPGAGRVDLADHDDRGHIGPKDLPIVAFHPGKRQARNTLRGRVALLRVPLRIDRLQQRAPCQVCRALQLPGDLPGDLGSGRSRSRSG